MSDIDRLRELVLYIAHRAGDDPEFGRTKMAKVLFYSDFEAYRERGEPITGTAYQRRDHGPYPPQLYMAELDLTEGTDRARILHGSDPNEPQRLVPRKGTRPPELDDVPQWQLDLIDKWIGEIQPLTAREASRRSHEEPGWQLARDRETIPYQSAFTSRRRPSRRDFERGRELADEYGWP